MTDTLDWYRTNADAFAAQSLAVDLTHLHAPFLARLPPCARVLDLGCGSGRDTAVFLAAGHAVTAMDPSPELASRAAQRLAIEVTVAPAQSLDAHARFDGVWACASLLHVPLAETDDVWARIARALVPGGVVYASYKLGAGERTVDGRFFLDRDEPTLRSTLERAGLTPLRLWETADARPERAHERWINALAQR